MILKNNDETKYENSFNQGKTEDDKKQDPVRPQTSKIEDKLSNKIGKHRISKYSNITLSESCYSLLSSNQTKTLMSPTCVMIRCQRHTTSPGIEEKRNIKNDKAIHKTNMYVRQAILNAMSKFSNQTNTDDSNALEDTQSNDQLEANEFGNAKEEKCSTDNCSNNRWDSPNLCENGVSLRREDNSSNEHKQDQRFSSENKNIMNDTNGNLPNNNSLASAESPETRNKFSIKLKNKYCAYEVRTRACQVKLERIDSLRTEGLSVQPSKPCASLNYPSRSELTKISGQNRKALIENVFVSDEAVEFMEDTSIDLKVKALDVTIKEAEISEYSAQVPAYKEVGQVLQKKGIASDSANPTDTDNKTNLSPSPGILLHGKKNVEPSQTSDKANILDQVINISHKPVTNSYQTIAKETSDFLISTYANECLLEAELKSPIFKYNQQLKVTDEFHDKLLDVSYSRGNEDDKDNQMHVPHNIISNESKNDKAPISNGTEVGAISTEVKGVRRRYQPTISGIHDPIQKLIDNTANLPKHSVDTKCGSAKNQRVENTKTEIGRIALEKGFGPIKERSKVEFKIPAISESIKVGTKSKSLLNEMKILETPKRNINHASRSMKTPQRFEADCRSQIILHNSNLANQMKQHFSNTSKLQSDGDENINCAIKTFIDNGVGFSCGTKRNIVAVTSGKKSSTPFKQKVIHKKEKSVNDKEACTDSASKLKVSRLSPLRPIIYAIHLIVFIKPY